MNITFLIGNGFDIQMGLASACRTVEAHYISLKKEDSWLQAFQQRMEGQKEYWSDFETAIGEYTNSFADHQQAKYQLCLDDFSVELIQYLQREESKIDYTLCLEETQKEFFRSFSNYDADIPNRYKNEINAIISKNNEVHFRFVSFNYTHVFDNCLKQTFTKNNMIVGNHVARGTRYNHFVNKDVLHIHGELPGPIIMGVDNQDQVLNKKWAEQRRFQQKLIKPVINNRAGSLVDDNVKKLIIESSIICIFGMSLGETDKTWWKLLGNWLKGEDRRLVIFGHNDDYSQVGLTHPRRFAIQDDLIDRFLDLAEIQETERDLIADKIFAVINPRLFNINLVQLTDQKKKSAGINARDIAESRARELEEARKLTEARARDLEKVKAIESERNLLETRARELAEARARDLEKVKAIESERNLLETRVRELKEARARDLETVKAIELEVAKTRELNEASIIALREAQGQ